MNDRQPQNLPSSEQLVGRIVPIVELQASEREAMFRLLQSYFLQVERAAFEHDLQEKTWAILLHDPQTKQLGGFSTLMCWQLEHASQALQIFFSGDTIIDRAYWGSTVLPRLWSQFVFQQAALIPLPSYWFLISSGYKTYRFLPVFFNQFYPTYREPTPPQIKALLDQLGHSKYTTRYNPINGIITLENATPLRPEIAEITAQRRNNRDIAFFEQINPGHTHGDELACLVPIHPDNLTRAGRRMVYGS